jgi:hypothetical protein
LLAERVDRNVLFDAQEGRSGDSRYETKNVGRPSLGASVRVLRAGRVRCARSGRSIGTLEG